MAFTPIPKPEKRIKEPKPLQSKPKVSRFLCKDCGTLNSKIGKERYNGCVNCGSTMTHSLPPAVPNRIQRKLKTTKVVLQQPAKPMKRTRIKAKIDPIWAETRKEWFALNPPDWRGLYECALCPWEVPAAETTLDHILTRSSRPDLVYVLDNLQPAHGQCNTRRGSMTMQAYTAKYGHRGALLVQMA